jgi:hypothetical protein
MKKILLPVLMCVLITVQSKAQTDSLLLSIQDTAKKAPLLPSKMIFTQRFLWGEKGFLRVTGVSPLTEANREKELKLRRGMLVTHQILGYVTLGGMIAQGIVGQQLYNVLGNKEYTKGGPGKSLNTLHSQLAAGVNITYFSTAAMALFSPPPLINRKSKKVSSIRLHEDLAIVHFTAMVATNILANYARRDPTLRAYHRDAAYTAFVAFTLAMVVMKF